MQFTEALTTVLELCYLDLKPPNFSFSEAWLDILLWLHKADYSRLWVLLLDSKPNPIGLLPSWTKGDQNGWNEGRLINFQDPTGPANRAIQWQTTHRNSICRSRNQGWKSHWPYSLLHISKFLTFCLCDLIIFWPSHFTSKGKNSSTLRYNNGLPVQTATCLLWAPDAPRQKRTSQWCLGWITLVTKEKLRY